MTADLRSIFAFFGPTTRRTRAADGYPRMSPIYRREPTNPWNSSQPAFCGAQVHRGAMLSQASLNAEPVPRQFDGTDPAAESII